MSVSPQYISKIINKAFGLGTHEPASIESSDDFTKYGTCKHCLQKISSYWIEDDDRLNGWSEWRGKEKCLVPPQ